MIRKITLSFTKFLFLFGIFLFAEAKMHAQTIVPQQLDGLEKLCAGNSFNEFFATFSYVNFPAGTTFAVELVDTANNPIATTLLQTTDLSVTQKTIKFAVPVNLVGSDTYGLRIKSSTGYTSVRYKNSLGNTSFPAYFKDYESSFSINNKETSAIICSGGTITLSIDDNATSPLKFPNLKYKWFKDGAAIAGQSGKTLTVNATGDYYVTIDYGECTDPNFSSNHIAVGSSSSGAGVTINSSLGNPFCASGTGTVLTATAGNTGNSYVWKKDGTVITGVNTRTYSTNESGLYTVEVDFGGCKATGSINLQSNGFEASIDAEDGYKISEGESVTVTVTTDATSPKFEWYLNNNLITGETGNTYTLSVKGNYKVIISQASGCTAKREFSFRINGDSGPSSVIPNIIKLNGMNPYWNIPDEYKNANTQVIIISSNGDKVLDVFNYQGDWPQNSIDFKNVNPVYYYVIKGDAGEKKGSITVIK